MRREIKIFTSLLGIIFLFLLGLSACGSPEKVAENKTIVVSTPTPPPTAETVNSLPKNSVGENKTGIAEIPKPSATVKGNSSAENSSKENSSKEVPVEQTTVENFVVDIAKLANRSPGEIDKMLGQAIETNGISVPKPGVYRVYKIAGEPKGLAIRFYGGRAKSFNLILSVPVSTANEALKKTFAIDVGNQPPTKNKSEPLTDTWRGTFGGIKFSKVSAKREANNKGFVFVLAEAE